MHIGELIASAVSVAGSMLIVLNFFVKHWRKFEDLYQSAKSAYFIVEKLAKDAGLERQEKIEMFKAEFKELMELAGHYVTKDNIKTAQKFVEKFIQKYERK